MLFGALCAPALSHAAESAGYNTGFVGRSIWYSVEKPMEGDHISIYTALFNARTETLSGTVAFYDGAVILGKKDFSILGHTVATVSVDWTVSAGDHAIRAEVINPTIIADGAKKDVYFSDATTAASTFSIKKSLLPGTGDASAPSPSAKDVENKHPISKAITEHVPVAVSAPVITATGKIDAWRESTGASYAEKATASKKEIAEHAKESAPGGKKVESEKALSPFIYVKHFFQTAVAYVFSHQAFFYVFAGFVLFLALRFTWSMIWRRYF